MANRPDFVFHHMDAGIGKLLGVIDQLKELRAAYYEWDASLPLNPEDARYGLVHDDSSMARSAG